MRATVTVLQLQLGDVCVVACVKLYFMLSHASLCVLGPSSGVETRRLTRDYENLL